MTEDNNTTKWLRYLLYVGIAALVNSLLGVMGLGGLSRWLGYAVSAAALYLMFRLAGSNGRYLRAVLFAGAALLLNILGIQQLALATSICGIVGQYQEYLAHSELIAGRDSKLAAKWSSLFWLQFAVELITVLLLGLAVGILVAAANMEVAVVTSLITMIIAVITLILKVLYLSYLKRTIALLENEAVAE